MNQKAASSDMPLHCNICPKKPNFSDVSHLLTHIASKGHLSNYFKTQVKAGHDAAALQEIADYDRWYNIWNVQTLMSDRMDQKEKKKGNNGQSTPRRTSFQATPASTRTTPSFMSNNNANTNRRFSGLRENVLDPQLDRRVKEEPFSRSVTPTSVYEYSAMYPRGFNAPVMLGAQNWPGTAYNSSVYAPTEDSMKQEDMESSYDSDECSEYEGETKTQSRRKRRRNASGSTVSLQIPNDEDYEIGDTIIDSSKMKGVYWSGMAMFDSATPEMKRKRNQKKSFSVVQQLQTTSDIIQPAEMVYDAGWTHRKTRLITGEPNDSGDDASQLSGETTPEPPEPTKKKQPRRARKPLQEKSTNSGRPIRGRGAALRNVKSDFDGQEDDDDLTYVQSKPRKRNTLSIHRDNSGPEITFNEPSTFGLLTSGFNTTYRNTYQIAQVHPHVFHQEQQTYHQQSMQRGPQRGPPVNNFLPNTIMNPMPNLGSFGSLNSNTMFQTGGMLPMTGIHQQGFNSFPPYQFGQQQYVSGHPSLASDASGFPVGSNQNLETYATANKGIVDLTGNTDVPAKNMNETPSVNPLFLSSQNTTDPEEEEEDDDATVSGPPSES